MKTYLSAVVAPGYHAGKVIKHNFARIRNAPYTPCSFSMARNAVLGMTKTCVMGMPRYGQYPRSRNRHRHYNSSDRRARWRLGDRGP